MLNPYKYKILIVFLSLTIIFMWFFDHPKKDQLIKIVKNSFITPTFLLEDIDEAVVRPCLNESDHQIFFLETSCAEKCECPAKFSDRTICAIESTARLHPDHKIYVLFVNSDGFEANHKINLLQKVFEYKNVFLRKVNLTKYSVDTPLEQFFASKRHVHSDYMKTHLSDVLRLLTLWKYGGMYLDTDIVCVKNFSPLGVNYAASENFDTVMNGILNFGGDELGRSFAQQCVEEVNNTFDGYMWSFNGPLLITRVLQRVCHTNSVDNMTTDACSGFQVLPRELFAPVGWQLHQAYFTEENWQETMKCVKEGYAAHIFNHMSSELQVMKASNAPYALLAKEYCPDMFYSSGSCF